MDEKKAATLEQLLESARQGEALTMQVAQAAQAEMEKKQDVINIGDTLSILPITLTDPTIPDGGSIDISMSSTYGGMGFVELLTSIGYSGIHPVVSLGGVYDSYGGGLMAGGSLIINPGVTLSIRNSVDKSNYISICNGFVNGTPTMRSDVKFKNKIIFEKIHSEAKDFILGQTKDYKISDNNMAHSDNPIGIKLSGGKLVLDDGLYMNATQIKYLAPPTDDLDAANKKYVDDAIAALKARVAALETKQTDGA